MANDAQGRTTSDRSTYAYRYVRRGAPLSTYLVIYFALSIVAIVSHLSALDRPPAGMPSWTVPVLSATVFLRPFFIIAIWFWSRLGVLGFLILSAVSVAVVSVNGFWSIIFGVVGPTLLIVLIRERWQFMRWGFSPRSRRVSDDEE